MHYSCRTEGLTSSTKNLVNLHHTIMSITICIASIGPGEVEIYTLFTFLWELLHSVGPPTSIFLPGTSFHSWNRGECNRLCANQVVPWRVFYLSDSSVRGK